MDVDAGRAALPCSIMYGELVVRVGHQSKVLGRVERRVADRRPAGGRRVRSYHSRRAVAPHDQLDARGLARDAGQIRSQSRVHHDVPHLRQSSAESIPEHKHEELAYTGKGAHSGVFQQNFMGPGAVLGLAPLDTDVGRVTSARTNTVHVHRPVIRRARRAGLRGPAAQRSQIFQGRRCVRHHSDTPLQNLALGLVKSKRPVDHTRALSGRHLRRRDHEAARGHKSNRYRPRIVLLIIIAAPP
mmetsp:Transcript_11755/g.30739  ORF Transcript_11755/g.30739 Transcript_11755/m.30739 type:complete len:243 (+) Transcript_11755:399-1127(+)